MDGGSDGRVFYVRPLQVLKGSYRWARITTRSGAACGVDNIENGKDYVFFIPARENLHIDSAYLPAGSAEQVLL